VGGLFDAYLAVDWSARSLPSPARPTPDSVWIGERVGRAAQEWNPRTRLAARDLLEARIAFHVAAARRVFVGFDFALGYPAGFARSLSPGITAPGFSAPGVTAPGVTAPGISAPVVTAPGVTAPGIVGGPDRPWRRAWRELERLVSDGPDNANNRFAVAAALNARCGGLSSGPFWGCPPSHRCETLASVSPAYPYAVGSQVLQRMRWTDRGGAQPVWKLYGNGSVGSQTLLGIPVVAYLRFGGAFGESSRVWPFETGFSVPSSSIVYAEVWPTLAKAAYEADVAVKDQRQVRATVTWLSEMDDDGTLGALFGRPRDLPDEGAAAAVDEEGWILGIGP
jgi:hypothetical protein